MLPGALLHSTAFGAANKTLKPYLTDLEQGWKDTVQMHPGELTRIGAKFDLKSYAAPQNYVFHCHMLEHESNSMMRPYRVVA